MEAENIPIEVINKLKQTIENEKREKLASRVVKYRDPTPHPIEQKKVSVLLPKTKDDGKRKLVEIPKKPAPFKSATTSKRPDKSISKDSQISLLSSLDITKKRIGPKPLSSSPLSTPAQLPPTTPTLPAISKQSSLPKPTFSAAKPKVSLLDDVVSTQSSTISFIPKTPTLVSPKSIRPIPIPTPRISNSSHTNRDSITTAFEGTKFGHYVPHQPVREELPLPPNDTARTSPSANKKLIPLPSYSNTSSLLFLEKSESDNESTTESRNTGLFWKKQASTNPFVRPKSSQDVTRTQSKEPPSLKRPSDSMVRVEARDGQKKLKLVPPLAKVDVAKVGQLPASSKPPLKLNHKNLIPLIKADSQKRAASKDFEKPLLKSVKAVNKLQIDRRAEPFCFETEGDFIPPGTISDLMRSIGKGPRGATDINTYKELAKEESGSFFDFYGDDDDGDEARETGFVESMYEESLTTIVGNKEDRIERIRARKGDKAAVIEKKELKKKL